MLGWGVSVVSVVLSDEPNDHSRPKSEHNASVSSPSVDSEDISVIALDEVEGFRKDEYTWDNCDSHENSGESNLGLEHALDVFNSNSS